MQPLLSIQFLRWYQQMAAAQEQINQLCHQVKYFSNYVLKIWATQELCLVPLKHVAPWRANRLHITA